MKRTCTAMNNSTSTRLFAASIILAIAISCFGQSAVADQISANAPLRYKLRVSDPMVAGEVFARGGGLVADYGSFEVFRVSESILAEFATRAGIENISEQNVIALNTGGLNTLSPRVMALRA